MTQLSEREKQIRLKLKTDFPHYAAKCLQIRSKSGQLRPLILNKAQLYFHERVQAHKAKNGKVRVLLGKGRQTGFSTYIGGRFYHITTHGKGLRSYILTHEQTATDNLFDMVNRFHDHCPSLVKPHTGASNAKELYFDRLDSGYTVGTAGTKAVGRSQTIQLLHGSEVAFWPNAAGHFAGIVQAVPDLEGTEIILESTGNGVGGEFHERWQVAEAGGSDYEAIFVPWFYSEEYQRVVPENFKLTQEETKYLELYALNLEQMAWRRSKIAELNSAELFAQEYPATAVEMFQNTGHDSYIKAEDVIAARKNNLEAYGPLILGADPARFGDDRFSLAFRKGRKILKTESKLKLSTVDGANWLRQVIDNERPARVFIDLGGQGAGVFDILVSWGKPYEQICVGVNFGGSPQEPIEFITGEDGVVTKKPGPKNRRAEMWKRSNEWLRQEGGADIPDEDSLQADACAPKYSYDVGQRLQLESKEQMRSRGIRSPDEWDAVALTFAEPVRDVKPGSNVVPMRRRYMQLGGSGAGTGWLGN